MIGTISQLLKYRSKNGQISPFQIGAKVCVQEEGVAGINFEQLLFLYMTEGFVISSPEYFGMMRFVDSKQTLENIRNPLCRFENCDSLYVEILAGNLALAWRDIPDSVKLRFENFLWLRKNHLRVWSVKNFSRLAKKMLTTSHLAD